MALFETSDKVMLVFVAFSIPFYILFLLTILINRHKEPFNSSFFVLCFSLGVADVATLFHTYIFVKAPGWSWGHLFWVEYGYRGSFLSYYGNMVLWALALAQNIGVLLIAMNRFTAVVFTFRQQKIWSTRNITIAIALQWIIPILFVAPMLTTEFEYVYWGAGPDGPGKYSDNVNIDFYDYNYEEGYFIAAVFINLTVNLTTCIMYIAVLVIALRVVRKRIKFEPAKSSNGTTKTAVVVHKNGDEVEETPEQVPSVDNGQLFTRRNPIHREAASQARSLLQLTTTLNQSKTQAAAVLSQKSAYNRELRLAVSGFLMFIAMLVYFIFLLSEALGEDDGTLYNIATDVFSCISPYTLFLMSKQTRLALMKTLTCKKM